MTRSNPYLDAFNAGEFSPRMVGRVTFNQYDNAGAQFENLLLIPQGGFQRRPGSRYIASVKDSSSTTVLLRFQFSTQQAYIIEAGDRYFRFFRNQGQLTAANIGASITNGTFDSDISGWTDRSNGTGAISHTDSTTPITSTHGAIMSLDAAGSGNEAIAEQSVTTTTTGVEHILAFEVIGAPGEELTVRIGSSSGASDYLADTTRAVGMHTIAFTPAVSPFYIQFEYGENRSIGLDNVSLLDNTAVELQTPYNSSSSSDVLYEIKYTQSADVMYLAHPDYWPRKLLRRGTSDWSLEPINFQDGPFLTENETTTTLTLGGTTGYVSVTASATTGINDGLGFSVYDVGRMIRWKDPAGDWTWLRITDITSTTVVNAVIDGPDASGTTGTASWRLGLISYETAFPGAVGFFEERLYFAGSDATPQRFDGSVTADFEKFSPSEADGSVVDDNAIVFTIASEQVNRIRWLAPSRILGIGTEGGEFVASSSGAAITPSDIEVRQNTANGVANISPVKVNNRILFLQRAKRKIRDFRFSFEEDSYIATDATILADHITESGIIQMAYQQEPDSLVWCLRADGQLATMVYEPGQQVIGWSRQIFGGNFGGGDPVCESVATIPGQDAVGQVFPSDDRDEVWVVVKRTINGGTVRYVEMLEQAYEGPLRESYETEAAWTTAVLADQEDAFYVDSGLTYDGSSTTTISGLDHLEGETVDIWADGKRLSQETVSSGSITMDVAATKAQVGLPYTWKFKSLKLPFGASAGGSTGVAKLKRSHRVTYILLDATLFNHGTSQEDLFPVEFRIVSDEVDEAVPLFTGEKSVIIEGTWETDPRIYMQGVGPGPFVCLAIAPEMATNDFA